ncbi:MAG: peptide deformylase [Mariniblastus sp.]|nr:peptide deformylase [Mariniblastus sp.]
MEIVYYPHPTLRYPSKTVRRVDRELRSIVREMFELMYDARGIGLAANQVDLPLQLFVVNASGDPEGGEELVFVNPVIDQPKGSGVSEEGCLSIPGVHADVNRPSQVHVTAYDLEGNEIDTVVDGLLARVIQHEYDHLQGVLFIDRISDSAKKQVASELEAFEFEFQSQRAADKIPDEQAVHKRLAEIESRYC